MQSGRAQCFRREGFFKRVRKCVHLFERLGLALSLSMSGPGPIGPDQLVHLSLEIFMDRDGWVLL
jgi:hypothetical protein